MGRMLRILQDEMTISWSSWRIRISSLYLWISPRGRCLWPHTTPCGDVAAMREGKKG
jgi:hypothetical protein